MTEEQVRAEGFRQAEASNLLEGLDSSGDVFYQALKARVISGALDIDDAIKLMVVHCQEIARASVKEYAVAV